MIFSQALFIEKHLRSGGVSVTVRRLCVKVFPQLEEPIAKVLLRHSGESRNPGFSAHSGPRFSPG